MKKFYGAQMHDSYYAASVNQHLEFSPLGESTHCDVCVVGAGYTGLSTALNLRQKGFSVVVLEAKQVGWGASGRNGGQLGSGLNWSQKELEKEFGLERARWFWNFCEEAKREVKLRIRNHCIDCDFKHGIMGAAVTRCAAKQYAQHVEHLQEAYGCESVRYVNQSEISSLLGTGRYWGGMLDSSAGHLHPLNYALGLANAAVSAGVNLYENSAATSFKRTNSGPNITVSTGATVKAQYLVFACNAYIGRVAPEFSRYIMPFTSYIVATEPLDPDTVRRINPDDIAVYDSKFCLDYYRLSADRRLLFGGAERYLPSDNANIAGIVKPRILHLYPELGNTKIEYAWGGKIAITVNRLPSIGRIASEIFYAQGFSGHGVALTNMTGKILAETIAGTAESFDILSAIPHKKFPGGQLMHWPIHVLTMTLFDLRDRLSLWRQRLPAKT